MKLIFATHNNHKLSEVKKMLSGNIELLSLNNINCFDEIAETANTLEGNASLKSRYVYENYAYNCFSDDTGLEVEALGMLPGVISARYAGEQKNASDNMEKLLFEMHKINNRKARFRTVISLIINGEEFIFEGIVNGSIIEHKQGKEGFGYDPIFMPDGYTVTFAEMALDEKNKISHRGQAIAKLVEFLNKL